MPRVGIRSVLIAIAVAISLQLSGRAWADVVTLQSKITPSTTYQTLDVHVRNNTADLATTSNNTRVVFGPLAGSGTLRGLFSYPLTGFTGGIPAGATINSVEFHVVQVDADSPASPNGDIAIELRSISESFSEGAPVTGVGGANWNNTFGATMTLGSTILTSALMNPNPTVVPVQGTPSTWIDTTFASTSSLVSAVQAQLDANQPFNFALVAPAIEETGGVRKIFRVGSNTEVNTGTANRPRLIIDYTLPPAGLSGDYNDDGAVDAADYVMWMKNVGGDGAIFAPGSRDPMTSNPINSDDYDFWATNYGNPGSGGTSGNGGSVPEPGALALVLLAMAASLTKRRRS